VFQAGPRRAGLGEADRLDRTESAHVFRDFGDAQRDRQARAVEVLKQRVDAPLVVGDERALGAPLGSGAERVEARAAEPLEPREQAQEHKDPRAELDLAWATGRIVPAREERRREVKTKLANALELGVDPGAERRLAVQTRHLVFILVRHQLREALRHRDRERTVASGAALGRRGALDEPAVAVRIGSVLVRGQQLSAVADDRVERVAERLPGGPHRALDRAAVVHPQPAQCDGE